MTYNAPVREGAAASTAPSHLLLLAVAACLAAPASGHAQTTPHQSAQRASIGSGIGQSEMPRGAVFEPRLEAAAQYANNINLAEDGQDQIDTFGLELAPGFFASYSSGEIRAAIDYSLIGRAWEDSDFNDVSQQLSANGEWRAVPEWFSVSGQATYTDTVLDPRDGLNYGGLGIFGSGNLVEVAAVGVTPRFEHRFNDVLATAQYSYGRTWYLDEGKGQPTSGFVSNQDSTDQDANVRLASAEFDARFFAAVFYDWQKSEFDTALPYEYERSGLDLEAQLTRTLRFVGDVGKESDLDASTTEGGLDSDFWSTGLRWQPSERSSLEGRYGERFFGSSYSANLTHRARMLEFYASYSEEPTVETRTLSLGGFDPGQLAPGSPNVDFGRFNSAPFIARNASAGVTAVGSRTNVSLSAFQYERDYIRGLLPDEDGLGVSLGATRQLASNLSADFTLSYSDYEQSAAPIGAVVSPTSNYSDVQALFRLNREVGSRLTLSGEMGYLARSGDSDYDGWWLAVRGRWMP